MDTINAKEFDLKTILSNKYTVDYFQREYKWERKNIEELIDDLRTAFFDNYKKADIAERSALYAELAKKIWTADLSELI